MNEHDSEVLAGMLEDLGFTPSNTVEDAGLILLNTCCVREKAESKAFGRLGELALLKRRHPDLILGVCGCMVQQPAMAENLMKRIPALDLVFGTHNVHRLPDLLTQVRNGVRVQEVWDEEGDPVEGLPVKRSGVKAYVTITYGCNNFCTYCIVPYVRGRERSRQPDDVVDEVQNLVADGCREVTLLGQNVNSYGSDLSGRVTFAQLLQRLDTIEGLFRIRYMTSHPRDFTEELIDVIAGSRRICEHFHLPVQAGSNRILQAMHRGYTRGQYLELVREIRDRLPFASITTDIIVGFPGEKEEDFLDTLDLVKLVKFDSAFTFLYSPRTGTPAEKMPDQVPMEEKKRRFQQLLEVQNTISLQLNQDLVGKVVELMVEGQSKTDPVKLAGRTRTNKLVSFDPGQRQYEPGQLVGVRITEAKTWSLYGEVV